MSARDDYPWQWIRIDAYERHLEMCAEIDRLRAAAALGLEVEWEIEHHSDPYLMGVRARVEAGDGFTQNTP